MELFQLLYSLPKQGSGKTVILFQEEEHCGYTDGTFNGRRYFQCNARKAMFVSLNMCQKDGRFQDVHPALSDTKIKGNQEIFILEVCTSVTLLTML